MTDNPIVMLNSGSFLMEVISVEDSVALCEWVNNTGRLARIRLPVACLTRLLPEPFSLTAAEDVDEH